MTKTRVVRALGNACVDRLEKPYVSRDTDSPRAAETALCPLPVELQMFPSHIGKVILK